MNNPLKYVDPTGHFSWGAFFKIFRAFVGSFVQAFMTVIGGILLPINPMLGIGLIVAGGIIGGAIRGGLSGIVGTLIGSSIVGAIIYGGIKGGGLGALMTAGAIISPVFAATLSYKQGGWQGLATFGASLAGAILGSMAGAAVAAPDTKAQAEPAQSPKQSLEEVSDGNLYAYGGKKPNAGDFVEGSQDLVDKIGNYKMTGQAIKAMDDLSTTIPAGQEINTNLFVNPITKDVIGIEPVNVPVLIPADTIIKTVPVRGTGTNIDRRMYFEN